MSKGFSQASQTAGSRGSSSPLLPATDCEQMHQHLQEQFENLVDPRGKQGVQHRLVSIVMIALLATIGGA
jgi:hypothetical protein